MHQPIPVSPKTPSQIWGVGVPVIIGPLNGGMEYPPAFRSEQGHLSRLALLIGRLLANSFNLVIPGKRLASLVLVANGRTKEALPAGIKGDVVEMVENGVDLTIWRKAASAETADRTVRFTFIGRLIDWKAVEIVLEALHRLQGQISASLEIIGDGPMRETWETMTDRLGLKSVVTFSGFMSQQDCAERLKNADVLVLPSLFECGGAVVLEAMAVGLPVIATAWGGPLDYLDETCGILVEPDSREALVAGFATGMKTLAQSHQLRTRMGEAGYARARQYFDWQRKIDQILELYQLAQEPTGRPKSTTPAGSALEDDFLCTTPLTRLISQSDANIRATATMNKPIPVRS